MDITEQEWQRFVDAVERVALSIFPGTTGGQDVHGGTVLSLTESMMGVAESNHEIALNIEDAGDKIADAITVLAEAVKKAADAIGDVAGNI